MLDTPPEAPNDPTPAADSARVVEILKDWQDRLDALEARLVQQEQAQTEIVQKLEAEHQAQLVGLMLESWISTQNLRQDLGPNARTLALLAIQDTLERQSQSLAVENGVLVTNTENGSMLSSAETLAAFSRILAQARLLQASPTAKAPIKTAAATPADPARQATRAALADLKRVLASN
jgi:hypothetical protein